MFNFFSLQTNTHTHTNNSSYTQARWESHDVGHKIQHYSNNNGEEDERFGTERSEWMKASNFIYTCTSTRVKLGERVGERGKIDALSKD
jgi:hypothetical protein